METLFKTYIESGKILVFIGNNPKFIDKEIKIIIKNNDNVINDSIVRLTKNIHFWYYPPSINDLNTIYVDIYYDNIIVFKDVHRIKKINGELMPKQAIFIHNVGGMGDYLSSEPTIRKLSEIFDQKIKIYSYYPELLKNHPCVSTVTKIDTYYGDYEQNILEEERKEYNIHYILINNITRNGTGYNWANIDFKQLCAIQCGFNLTPDDLQIHFYPDEYQEVPNLPDKYVCINPNSVGSNTWSKEKWQKLIDSLNDLDINVVSIGKKTETDRNFYEDIKIKKGLNLCGSEYQNTLSQAHHIINKSDIFITPDTGLFILAGTTDAHIILIGGAWESKFHFPYRNGTVDYKMSHLTGNCEYKHCISNMNLMTHLHGRTDCGITSCYLNLELNDWKCHPSYEEVLKEIIRIHKS